MAAELGQENLFVSAQIRKDGGISREEYWKRVQNFASELMFFAQLQDSYGIKVIAADGKIVVSLPVSATHESKIQMALNPRDIRSMPLIALADGDYEPFQSDLLVGLGKISNHFIDIGANTGFYTLALAMENKNISITAFEPQPSVFADLVLNIELNGLQQNIVPHNLGVGDKHEVLTMFVPSFTGTVGGSFKDLHAEEGEAAEIQVPVITLDSHVNTPFDLIKIDVEGFEFAVLGGAINSISRYKPTIVVELLRKWMKPFNTTPQHFMDVLLREGYECLAIKKSKLSSIKFIDSETVETNFIFCHPTHTKHYDFLAQYK